MQANKRNFFAQIAGMKKFKIFTLFLLTMSMLAATAACGEKTVETPDQNHPKQTLTQTESEGSPAEDKNSDCPDCQDPPKHPGRRKHHKRSKDSEDSKESENSKETSGSKEEDNVSEPDDGQSHDDAKKFPRVNGPRKPHIPIRPVPLPQPRPKL